MDTATKGVLITAALAVIGHLVKLYFDGRNAVRNELRAKRVLIYTDLLQATQDALAKTTSGEQVLRDASLTTRIIAWATPGVIIAFTDVWQKIEGTSTTDEKLESTVKNLLAAIRKDFGHDDKQEGDLFNELIASIYVPKAAAEQLGGPKRG